MRYATALFVVVVWLAGPRSGAAAPEELPPSIAGFLRDHCLDCHAGPKPDAGLTLDGFATPTTIRSNRSRWRAILDRVVHGEMPPAEADQPSDAARDAFVAEVRRAFATADAGPPDPGPAVIRRLNRAEFDTTIRDLFQGDFRAAAAFPEDEVGHGFANIADVLTVSPLLMERLLDAAEVIAAQAIPAELPAPPSRRTKGRHLWPVREDLAGVEFREVNADGDKPAFTGPLSLPLALEPTAEYRIRARLYATSPAGQPVEVVLLADGKETAITSPPTDLARIAGAAPTEGRREILSTHTIDARTPEEAQTIEAMVARRTGVGGVAIGCLRQPEGQPAPTLHVEWIEVTGPLDNRPVSMRATLGDTPLADAAANPRPVLASFARRAWRGPVPDSQLDGLCRIVADAAAAGEPAIIGLRRAIAAVLASPRFLFRLESPPAADVRTVTPVPDVELATRLSYFLWSSCPDEELLTIAERGELASGIDGQVERMLADPRADALVDQFAMQWLGLERLAAHAVDPQAVPGWRPELTADMVEETRRFIRAVFRGQDGLLQLLDGEFTFVNRSLAAHYGLAVDPPLGKREWRRVSLTDTPRAGLVSQGSVLTLTSNPARTSPVKRGKWVLETLLDAAPPPAPPEVPALEEQGRDPAVVSFRARLERHRADPACAGCHRRMDAFGFTLERFDPLGRLRDRDSDGGPVDDRGDFGSGQPLDGVSGLRRHLRIHRREFVRGLARKLLIYAIGRGLESGDEPALAEIERAADNEKGSLSDLVKAVVRSPQFRLRRPQTAVADTIP
ncbi:filamin [Planctomycetia bacterium]|nr:filamin [Planctomycetia bacterium]